MVYCTIYPILTQFTKSRSKFAYFQGRLSRYITNTSPSETTRPESWPGDYMVRQPRSGSCLNQPVYRPGWTDLWTDIVSCPSVTNPGVFNINITIKMGITQSFMNGTSSCHIPPLPPNVTNGRTKPQQTLSVEKHAHPPRVVYCAIYPTLTQFTKSRVRNLHISKGGYPVKKVEG